MLVLTRKPNQSIIIGDHIELTVIEIRGDQVRIGIDAPKDVTVHRKEIYEQIKAQTAVLAAKAQEEAAKLATPQPPESPSGASEDSDQT